MTRYPIPCPLCAGTGTAALAGRDGVLRRQSCPRCYGRGVIEVPTGGEE